MNDHYFLEPLTAFVRGRLAELTPDELVELARAQGWRVHRYKRASVLPRVRKVLGLLHGLQPSELLDLGTGRGVFLWSLLDEFPELPVTCVDVCEDRVLDLERVRKGGIARLRAQVGDVRSLPFEDGSFDVVTALEVFEHLEDALPAAREACRVARRHVVVSVPSQEDDNPEHLRLFTAASLTALLQEAGASRVTVDHVLNHRIALATL